MTDREAAKIVLKNLERELSELRVVRDWLYRKIGRRPPPLPREDLVVVNVTHKENDLP